MEENIDIKVMKDDCPCKRCIWALGTPNRLGCGKFRVKPSSVFYDSQKCPRFEEEEFDLEDEDDE